jgi:hypothetical protein
MTKLESLEARKRTAVAISSGRPISPRWDECLEALFCIGAEWVEDRRVDGAGAEDVHANSSLLKLDQPG